MFFTYIKDQKSWLIFFFVSLALIDFILWIDEGISVEFNAILYFNILLGVLFLIFLVWRYQMETKFTKQLAELIEGEIDNWFIALPEATYEREKIVKALLLRAGEDFSKELDEAVALNLQEGDYTAAWVHEVKTPLTAMKLTIDEHRGNPAFRQIEAEWLRLHLLVDQQLSISRLSSLETDYVLEKTSVQKLVSAEVRELASWCMEKNIAVEFEGAALEVTADIKWCRFMIRQFLTNAIKYSPIGGTITILIEENESGRVQLGIQDEGPGIEAHDLPRIFEKGFTGGAGRIHNAATGLGLYLAQTVATKMGITIRAEAEKNKGTLIEITYPNANEYDKMLK